MPSPDFIAACWTSAGNAIPSRDSGASPISLRERIEAVAQSGYSGLGLRHCDLIASRASYGYEGIAKMLSDNAVHLTQLEWITDWWCTGSRRAQSDLVRRDLFECAGILGVDHIKVGADDNGIPVIRDRLLESFDELATDAAAAGVKIAFENTPFSHHVKTTEQAVEFILEVGNPNGGLLLDIWHAYRGGSDYSMLPRITPAHIVFGVELDDGNATVVGSHLDDTFNNRLLCGQGDFDVPAFIRAVHDIGYVGPWGIEHMSGESRALPVGDVLGQSRTAALSCFPRIDNTDGNPR